MVQRLTPVEAAPVEKAPVGEASWSRRRAAPARTGAQTTPAVCRVGTPRRSARAAPRSRRSCRRPHPRSRRCELLAIPALVEPALHMLLARVHQHVHLGALLGAVGRLCKGRLQLLERLALLASHLRQAPSDPVLGAGAGLPPQVASKLQQGSAGLLLPVGRQHAHADGR
eukprot:347295-Prymnesium_polylepis.3